MEQYAELRLSRTQTNPCDDLTEVKSFALSQERHQTNEMRALVNRLAKQCIAQVNTRLKSKMAHVWGYESSELPPDKWYQDYPIANGHNQSPIDILTDETQAKLFPKFTISYNSSDLKNVVNNGHTVTFFTSGGSSALSGGPLSSKYTLEQFHFHWGCDSTRGSEHLLDGKSFAAELHLVHWNSEKYNSFAESLDHRDGLCVLGAFLKSSSSENENYGPLISELKRVQLKGAKYDVEQNFDPSVLLPEDQSSYYHYAGSLTTPPLKESVKWVVFKNPVEVSEEQLESFRQLRFGETEESPCMCNNFRPPQDLWDRTVFSSEQS